MQVQQQQKQVESKQQLQTQIDQLSDEESDFTILQQQSANQTLLVKLKKNSEISHRGVVLFSSQKVEQLETQLFSKFIKQFGFKDSQCRRIYNDSKQLSYVVLSKQEPTNGKILILDQYVYKQKFFINLDYLLTINYEASQYNLKNHPNIKYLKLFQVKEQIKGNENLPNVYITLQSTKNSGIIQKFLGVKEVIYLQNCEILAMSESVVAHTNREGCELCLSGPGYVFFEAKKQKKPINFRQFGIKIALRILIIVLSVFLLIFMDFDF